jgi:hypothetical protein
MVLKQAFTKPENKAYEMDLIIFTKNQIKIKNEGITTKSANTQFLILTNHNFKKGTRFLYASTLLRLLLLGTPDI